jgi:cytochrome c556
MKYKIILLITVLFISCTNKKEEKPKEEFSMQTNDSRISLNLNAMQKQHQLSNMRSHLEAVQTIITLISNDNYKEASKVAYTKLGSTTEMQLMCASFGNKNFENMGLNFHKEADKMSEILKTKDKNKSLQALSKTMNSCISCHATFRQ